MTSLKDKINRITGITSLGIGSILLANYFLDFNTGLLNSIMLYLLMPIVLVWFGTRRNSCGSCNQDCTTPKTESEKSTQ